MRRFDLEGLLADLRRRRPLVHNITNYVAMNFTANTLLALGASPVMAHAPEEVEEMAALAGALVLNIGTLSEPWVEAMLLAGRRANELGIPVILDPVGAGATTLRTETFRRLAGEIDLSVVRGNASEILAVAASESKTRGVDAVHRAEEAVAAARGLARRIEGIVAVTGEVDLVSDGERLICCRNGHPLLGRVTATGCAATAAIGAFAAVSADPLEAACAGLALFGLAGQIAAARARAPGSFAVAVIDALYEIDPERFRAGAQLEETGDGE